MVNEQFARAVHIMTALAHRGGDMNSPALAASLRANPVVVRRLLLALRRAKLVETTAGRGGGTRLARPATAITLLDIYEALAPRPAIHGGRRPAWRRCPVSCSMKAIMSTVAARTEQALRRELREMSLAQMVRAIARPKAKH